MERATAIKRLTKRFGKTLRYRVDPKGLDADIRRAAFDEHQALKPEQARLDAALTARHQELLQDPIYQGILADLRALKARRQALTDKAYHYRIEVGTLGGLKDFPIFHVEAQGDSWEDIFRKLEEKDARRRGEPDGV